MPWDITCGMFLLIIACLVSSSSPSPCEEASPNAQPSDTRYMLGVVGDPDLFIPGELYSVFLKGVDSGHGPTPFIGFIIWAEVEQEANGTTNSSAVTINDATPGSFQTYDAQTKTYELCKPAVDNTTAHPKTEIQVIWSAPSGSVESCVRLRAKAFHSDPGVISTLARKLCPAVTTPTILVRQEPIVEPCCACDEAKYEVTFEGLWSRNIHPREFPPEAERAHFSDVIGASHTAQFRVWQEGRTAAAGLRRLADDGSTTTLEKELKSESDHIRTIIKARGISWQQVAGGGIPSTFAVFRVDAKHHLVSLASKLVPSPDWFVGVSALEMCNSNCTWRRSAIIPLYPYDAGTDNGITYMSRRSPTIPSTTVRALGPDWPRDERSPFHSTTGDMRPFARLRLNRLRLYEKNCDATEQGGEEISESKISGIGSCGTHAWGPWGPCSVTCGTGRSSRQRHYLWPSRAIADACRVTLTDFRSCHGSRIHCRVQSEYEPDPAESSGPCAISPWSEWSPCEGCGVRARTRHYIAPRAHKRCNIGFRARIVLSQAMPCEAGPCFKPPRAYANATNYDWFFLDHARGECPVSPWSVWSPCSAHCGRGKRIRTRLYLSRDSRVQQLLTRRLLHGWNQRFAELQNLESASENITSDNPNVELLADEHIERCQFTLTQQEALCDGEDDSCLRNLSEEVCSLPVSVGPCRRYEERWFYDSSRGVCEPFGYTGCGGNANNFRDRDSCKNACENYNSTELPVLVEASTKRLKATPSSADNEVMHDEPSVDGGQKT